MRDEEIRDLSREMMMFCWLSRNRIANRMLPFRIDTLSTAESLVLSMIVDGKRVPMSAIISRTLMAKQQATQVVNQLEAKGLVARTRPPQNRRTVILEATEKAIRIWIEACQSTEGMLSGIFEQLDEPALSEFLDAMRTVNRIMEKFPAEKTDK